MTTTCCTGCGNLPAWCICPPSTNGDRGQPRDETVLADGHRATDVGNANRLAALADGRIRYVNAWQKWLVYDGTVWNVDTSEALIGEFAKQVSSAMFAKAITCAGDDRERMWKWAKRSEAVSAVRAMVWLARGIPGVIVDHDDLDRQPWLLNVANGTVDLRTGELEPHDPEHLLTIKTDVMYDPDATAPLWESCLRTWQPDADMRGFLQRAIGSAATGHPVEHLFVNTGAGGNGKGKFFGAVQRALGPYAVVPDKSLVVLTRHEPHPTVRADLFGARMLLAPETEQGDRLAEAQIKELTGGDRMTGRRMREDPWEFWPTWTAFMHTNHRPEVSGTDEGVWRRLRLVPWDVTIPEDERDRELANKLAAEASGILTWIVAGAVAYHQQGLDDPPAVAVATDAYRTESDRSTQFLEESDLVLDPSAWMPSADLTVAHEKWCDDAGLVHSKQWQATSGELKKRGARPRTQKRDGRKVRGWEGIRER